MINSNRLCFGCMNDNGGEKICPICGYDSDSGNPEYALPVKFVISNRYLIGKVIKENGESITYIAWDNAKSAAIRIKEYFPQGFAHRNPDKTVSMVKGGEYTFNEGLLEFTEINGGIMNSDLPALVPVSSVFEENGTVYAASANISGITLESFLQKNGNYLKWEQARALFLPIIDTVKGMNDAGFIHRGISAYTIIVGRDGKLYIDDYSVKKLRINDSELKSQLFAGYSPVELYGFKDIHDGVYTDVYGLCATLFRVLIGVTPPEAPVRLEDNSMTVPAKFAEELPRHVLSALANGLQVLPENRTKNIEEFKNELVYAEMRSEAPVHRQKPDKGDDNVKPAKKKGSSAKYAVISAVCTALVFLVLAAVLALTVFKDAVFPKKDDAQESDQISISAPEVDSIGSIDSGAEVTAKQYAVPELRGKYYADIIDNKDYEMFEFVISDKNYSNDYPKGTICSQSVKAGDSVVRDTKINLVISLGSKEIKIANVLGLDELNAKLELLKQGFLYDNIEVLEKYDEAMKPGVVLDQLPKYGTSVSTEESVKIYVNSYKGEDLPESSTDDTDYDY